MSNDTKKISILLAEDSPMMRKTEIKALNSLGFDDIVPADNGEDAISKLKLENINHHRSVIQKEDADKSKLGLEGEYLSFILDNQDFGVDVTKIKEIIKMVPVRSIPRVPAQIKGVLNLRGNVIPIVDLRCQLGMDHQDFTEESCIVVLELGIHGRTKQIGIAVDAVSEVVDIQAKDIESTPYLGINDDMSHLLGIAMVDDKINMLLNIEEALAIGFDHHAPPARANPHFF